MNTKHSVPCIPPTSWNTSPTKFAEETEQMYPPIRMVRHALSLGLVVSFVVLALSACGGGPATMKTVAGDGGEQLGDGGPAMEAGFCWPTDVALDAEGNMYISDGGVVCYGPGGHTVRKVNPDGTITTVAGTGEPGFSGDGGPATKAQLQFPVDVEMDPEGNLYISEVDNHRIRKVDKDGTITTFAGTGKKGYSGDGGPATSAKLIGPGGLAFDAKGNLYFSDFTRVRKIDSSGMITTVAGTGRAGFSGDGGPATEAKIASGDVALDPAGNLYIADDDNHRIRKVDKDGIIHTVAGTGKGDYSGDGGPATEAALNGPSGIDFDGEGNLYITCHNNSVVRKVDENGTITTVAGTSDAAGGIEGFNDEKGPATEVWLNEPIGVFVDDDAGVLYIADSSNNRIRAVNLEAS
jgi:DNA-binding beta-propeller fold protein YncE